MGLACMRAGLPKKPRLTALGRRVTAAGDSKRCVRVGALSAGRGVSADRGPQCLGAVPRRLGVVIPPAVACSASDLARHRLQHLSSVATENTQPTMPSSNVCHWAVGTAIVLSADHEVAVAVSTEHSWLDVAIALSAGHGTGRPVVVLACTRTGLPDVPRLSILSWRVTAAGSSDRSVRVGALSADHGGKAAVMQQLRVYELEQALLAARIHTTLSGHLGGLDGPTDVFGRLDTGGDLPGGLLAIDVANLLHGDGAEDVAPLLEGSEAFALTTARNVPADVLARGTHGRAGADGVRGRAIPLLEAVANSAPATQGGHAPGLAIERVHVFCLVRVRGDAVALLQVLGIPPVVPVLARVGIRQRTDVVEEGQHHLVLAQFLNGRS